MGTPEDLQAEKTAQISATLEDWELLPFEWGISAITILGSMNPEDIVCCEETVTEQRIMLAAS